MKAQHPKALKVEALEPYKLKINWSTGETLVVDLKQKFMGHPDLERILDPKVFTKAHISGRCIEWFDTEFGDDNVYAWTREQMGEMSHEMFNEWMNRNGLSLTGVADAFAMSRRMIAYYRTGAKPIPRAIELACYGYEARQKTQKKKAA